MTDFPIESERLAPEVVSETRPLYWSVRRELWENRSIYLAPLVVAAVALFAFMISTIVACRRSTRRISAKRSPCRTTWRRVY